MWMRTVLGHLEWQRALKHKVCKTHWVNKFGKILVGNALLSVLLSFFAFLHYIRFVKPLGENISAETPSTSQIMKYSSALIFRFPFNVGLSIFIGIPVFSDRYEYLIPFSSKYCFTLNPTTCTTSKVHILWSYHYTMSCFVKCQYIFHVLWSFFLVFMKNMCYYPIKRRGFNEWQYKRCDCQKFTFL